ncbi:hypothetical protein PanWU01x14_019680, partial [Parasponia andersonii]
MTAAPATVRLRHRPAKDHRAAPKLHLPSPAITVVWFAKKPPLKPLEPFRFFHHRRRFRPPFDLQLIPLDSSRLKDHQ